MSVFILCTMRSYSSLICAMLGEHPELYGLPEINLAVAEDIGGMMDFYQRRPHGLHGLIRSVAQLRSGATNDDTVAEAEAWIAARRDWSTRRMLDWIEAEVAPRRIIDKSPVLVRAPAMLERLYRMRPEAQFLHVVRQPAAVCRSIDRLNAAIDAETGKSLSRRVDAEQVWLKCNNNVLEFRKRCAPGQCLTLQGEAFLGQFDRYAPQLCEWLGIRSDAEAMAAMLHPERSPYACLGPEAARYGNDPNFLKSPAFTPRPIEIEAVADGVDGRAFKPRTLKIARQLGYA
ncbi:sulfotransferase [Shimia sp.]|uniref:sulfotransferase family protein n=1 Tax=Shimia sp. TaxID=1954381 RepID=UPI003563F8D3